MSSLAPAVLLSLVSAVAYAAAAIVQERVAAGDSDGSYAPVRSAGWWAALGLNGAGGLLHVAALAYGPLSLVQPLGALTVVFALPMAALFTGRTAAAGTWRGAGLATAGLAGLLALTETGESRAPDGGERLALAAVAFAAIAALFVVARRVRRPMMRGVALAGGAGVAFGVASVFTKIVAEELPGRAGMTDLTNLADLTNLTDLTVRSPVGLLPGVLPGLLMIAATATAGLLLSQASYRSAGLAAPLATVTVVNPVVAAAVGVLLFGERFRYGPGGTALAVVCAVAAGAGLLLLTARRHPTAAGPAPGPVSDPDPAGAEVRQRIDVGAVPRAGAHLEVEMRSGAVAGGS
ncbi:DMT family transporter [Streptomyces sp. NPDC091376]|uniref:DMT family transporter n=1 Tax=Streptomyces sp. NPDC091376 TaxID=3365994 RepID=UPI00380BC831